MDLGEMCERYRRLTVAEVCDALYELHIHERVLPSALRPLLPEHTMAGEAFTVLGQDLSPPVGWDEGVVRVRAYLQMLEEVGPDSVMVCANIGPSRMGNFGELTANAVKQRGCAGVVLDGNLRDAAGMRQIGFQIYYRDLSPLNGIGRWQLRSFQQPVTIGDVVVVPGDVIVADFDGILAIARDDARRVLLAAENISAAETKVRAEMQGGTAPLASFQRHGHF